MKRSAFLVGLILLLALAGCGGGGGGGDPPVAGGTDGGGGAGDGPGARAKWTYMVYLGADNNLSSAGLADVNEMELVGSDANLNIVVQAEFSTRFTDFTGTGYQGETLRARIVRDADAENPSLDGATSIGNADMGSPATLTGFIQWAVATYPAEHYALVIWDHGAGWKAGRQFRGAVQDETSGSFMSLPDLARAVADAGITLDVINFDACLMAMYEVAYEFSDLTRFMTFSEETEPGDGDPYDTILADLKAQPAMDAAQLASTIVGRYIASYQTGARTEKVTKSAVDMSRVAALDNAVQELSAALVAEWTSVSGAVLGAQANAQRYEYPTNLDLYDFAARIDANLASGSAKAAAQTVMAAVAAAVHTNGSHGPEVAGSHGLAIYAPAGNQVSSDQMVNDLRDYARLKCSAARARGWLDAVETLVGSTPEQLLQPGGFAFYVEWNTDADVDLWVCEPDNVCYAPWTGQTSPNGFLSGDSVDTGESAEYYVANDYVQAGSYDVFLEYWEDGAAANYADVTFWYAEPGQAGGEWQSLGTVTLDLSAPGDYDAIPTFDGLNAYSNFWYTGALTRLRPAAGIVTLNAGDRELRVLVKHAKKRGLAGGKRGGQR